MRDVQDSGLAKPLRGGGGIMGRAQRYGRARRRAHGAGRSAYERVDSGLRPSSTATGHPRRARGSAGAPRERSRRWPRPNDCTRAPRPQNARRAQRCGCGQRTADSGQRTGQGKQQTLPRWRVCNAASRASSARCRVTPCGFATVPRALPAIRYGLARATLRSAGPGLPTPGRPTRTPGHPARSRERRSRLIPPQARSPLALDTPAARPRTPPVARPVGAAGPHRTDHPTSLAPTSCGDARPSAPCAAPRG